MVRSHQFFHFFCEGSAARRIFFIVSSGLLTSDALWWFEFATDSGFFADRRFRGIVGQRERKEIWYSNPAMPHFGNHFLKLSRKLAMTYCTGLFSSLFFFSFGYFAT
jgi:hypothetical protein